MPKTKRTPTRTPTAEPDYIQLRDPKHTIRRTARIISKRNGLSGGITGAISYAVTYTEAAERREVPPLNLADCTISQLEPLIVFGCDHYTRHAALEEYKSRVNGVVQKAQEKRS